MWSGVAVRNTRKCTFVNFQNWISNLDIWAGECGALYETNVVKNTADKLPAIRHAEIGCWIDLHHELKLQSFMAWCHSIVYLYVLLFVSSFFCILCRMGKDNYVCTCRPVSYTERVRYDVLDNGVVKDPGFRRKLKFYVNYTVIVFVLHWRT